MSKLIIKLDEGFFKDSFREDRDNREDIEKVIKKRYDNLSEVLTALYSAPLFLSQKEKLAQPENLPHVVSEWPVHYQYTDNEGPYGVRKVGVVKVED